MTPSRMSNAFLVAATLALAGATLCAPASAQGRIDPKRGEAVARTWCINCHVVASEQTGAVSADAPPFATLTTESGYDDERIRAFLREPHGPMEGFDPDERQINDLIAYIRTQNP